jgi:GDP-L-fucose synthase
MPLPKKQAKVFLAGHRGLVGSAILRRLQGGGYEDILVRTRQELDLTNQEAVRAFFAEEQPDIVIDAAAKVGGIEANRTEPADFIGLNLGIQQNLIWGAHEAGVDQLLFLGSSCIYPRITEQPIKESSLLTGPLEPTNAPYAIAKIAGLSLCESIQRQYGRRYFTVMPPNVYGPGDNFDPVTSHVLGAMIRRFHEAKPNHLVECWGTGTPKREFMHSDDLADACVWLLENDYDGSMINVGTGIGTQIKDLAEVIQGTTGHMGEITWDTSKPDGFPEKTMDVGQLHSLGWRHKIDLERGVEMAYDWFLKHIVKAA